MMTLRFNNGEGHANVKREIGLNWQNNNFAGAPLFLVQYDVKVPNFTKNSTPQEFAYTWQSKLVGIIAIKTENYHFHIDHNTPCLPPQILHIRCFQFLVGITAVPREIQNDGYAKFWGGKQDASWSMCKWWIHFYVTFRRRHCPRKNVSQQSTKTVV